MSKIVCILGEKDGDGGMEMNGIFSQWSLPWFWETVLGGEGFLQSTAWNCGVKTFEHHRGEPPNKLKLL